MINKAAVWTRKDLLGLENLSAPEIDLILDRAAYFKRAASPTNPIRALSGSFAALLFLEPSTRTRLSFEIALKRLGGEALAFASSASSLEKGETFLDTLKNLEAMGVHLFVIRCQDNDVLETVAPQIKASIVNAGDGTREHPTQALLDLFTLKEKKGKIEGLKVAIVGDILHSRVARSNAYALKKFGAKVVFCGPPDFLPAELSSLGAEISHDLSAALKNADAVIALRIQMERQLRQTALSTADYFRDYGLTEEKIKAHAAPDCVILHPGPLNRGVEIDSALADGPRSLILDQVQNGVFVRMAVLSLLKERAASKP